MRQKNVKAISSYIDIELWRVLKSHTIEKDTTIAKVVARLLRDYCAKIDKKSK